MLHGRMLRYLDEISRTGSIRKAAARLNIASSAINRHLLELEEEIGSPLFERLPRGLRLTTAGEMLTNHVRKTLKDYECVRTQVEALKGVQAGEVRIATVSGLADSVLGPVVERFRQHHPNIRLVIRVYTMEAGVNSVLTGETDMFLAGDIPKSPRLGVLASVERPLGAVMAPDHPLAASSRLRLAECLAYPIVVLERGISARDAVESSLPPGTNLMPALETNSPELLKRLARRTPVITFLSEIDIEEDRFFGNLVHVPVRELGENPVRLSLVHRTNGSLGLSAGLVAHEIHKRLGEGQRLAETATA